MTAEQVETKVGTGLILHLTSYILHLTSLSGPPAPTAVRCPVLESAAKLGIKKSLQKVWNDLGNAEQRTGPRFTSFSQKKWNQMQTKQKTSQKFLNQSFRIHAHVPNGRNYNFLSTWTIIVYQFEILLQNTPSIFTLHAL